MNHAKLSDTAHAIIHGCLEIVDSVNIKGIRYNGITLI